MSTVASGQPGGGGGMFGGGAVTPSGRLGTSGKSTGPTQGGGRQTCARAFVAHSAKHSVTIGTKLRALIMTLSLTVHAMDASSALRRAASGMDAGGRATAVAAGRSPGRVARACAT